jgi:hypothetical protein
MEGSMLLAACVLGWPAETPVWLLAAVDSLRLSQVRPRPRWRLRHAGTSKQWPFDMAQCSLPSLQHCLPHSPPWLNSARRALTTLRGHAQEPAAALALDQFVLCHRGWVDRLAATLRPTPPSSAAESALSSPPPPSAPAVEETDGAGVDRDAEALLLRAAALMEGGPSPYAESSPRVF